MSETTNVEADSVNFNKEIHATQWNLASQFSIPETEFNLWHYYQSCIDFASNMRRIREYISSEQSQ